MALRKPLVMVAGQIQQLQAGDTLNAIVTEQEQIEMTATDNLVIGNAVYIDGDDSVDKAKADAAATTEVLGLCVNATVDAAANGSIATDGAIITATRAQWDVVTGEEVDEVQDLSTFNGVVNGGNFTLTINVTTDDAFTTANILYDANQVQVEGAIDTAATTASVPNWTNGDITVALVGDLTANAASFTYDGNSVDATNQVELIATDVDLAGGGTIGDVSTSVEGFGGLEAGADYFLDPDTAGHITRTAPTTLADFVKPIGLALNDTQLKIDIGHSTLL